MTQVALGAVLGAGLAAATLTLESLGAGRATLGIHAALLAAGATSGALVGAGGLVRAVYGWARAPRRERAVPDAATAASLREIRTGRPWRWSLLAGTALTYPGLVLACLLWRVSLQGGAAADHLTFALAHASVVTLALGAALGALLSARKRDAPLQPSDLGLPPMQMRDGLPWIPGEADGGWASAPERGAHPSLVQRVIR